MFRRLGIQHMCIAVNIFLWICRMLRIVQHASRMQVQRDESQRCIQVSHDRASNGTQTPALKHYDVLVASTTNDAHWQGSGSQ